MIISPISCLLQPDPRRDQGCQDDGAHPRCAVGEPAALLDRGDGALLEGRVRV